jgi:NAD(P)-dependent dehydrogenase (short-subunit alcohol dehydrogenase family)
MTGNAPSQPRPSGLPLDLTGRTVSVAGGGSAGPGWSIGRASCITYARQGARVCVADRDAASAGETTALIRAEGGEAATFVGDMGEETDIARMFAEARERFGMVDVLHHNVGIGKTGGPMETSAADFDRIHAVNVRSLLLASQQVLPAMAECGRGAIIAISSVAGMRYVGYPHLAYSVTKAAVIQFTRMVAQEYAGKGVRANTVVPGLIDTPRIAGTVAKMFSESSLDEARAARARQVPLGRMGTAWDIAHACAFLASDAAAYVTGTELVVDGGLTGKYA